MSDDIKKLPFLAEHIAILGIFLIAAGPTQLANAQVLRTVAISGQDAPGLASGVQMVGLGYPGSNGPLGPAIDNKGRVVYGATVRGPGINLFLNDQIIWKSEDDGDLTLVTQTGNYVEVASLSNAGLTTFYDGFFGTNLRIVRESANTGLEVVIESGDVSPGNEQEVLSIIRAPAINDSGRVAFLGQVSRNGSSPAEARGIWSEHNGNALDLIARVGQAAPGTSSGKFSDLGFPVYSNSGMVAFQAKLNLRDSNFTQHSGIWRGVPGDLSPVALHGDEAIEAGEFATFLQFGGRPSINDRGQTAFNALIVGAASPNSNGRSIWIEDNADLRLIALGGDQAPGVGEEAIFTSFSDPIINGSGESAFLARISGQGISSENSTGIWSAVAGRRLSLVAREGEPAPGTPEGVVFKDLYNFTLNGAGQIAFAANLSGIGINNDNNLGIWAQRESGELVLIARTGDDLNIGGDSQDDIRQITSLQFLNGFGNEDGLPGGFNDIGEIAFGASFSGTSFGQSQGNGVFISGLVRVPEPSSLMLISCILLLGAYRIKRHVYS